MKPASSENRPYKRKQKRYQLTALIDIVERGSQEVVGRLVNLHTEGLMVIGDHPFEEGNLYQLDLMLPQKINDRSIISIDVDCLWIRPSEDNQNTTWSGFSIYSCTEEAKSDIDQLIEKMGV